MDKKINLGSKLAPYPTPVTVIGADVNGKVNRLEISHVGIVEKCTITGAIRRYESTFDK